MVWAIDRGSVLSAAHHGGPADAAGPHHPTHAGRALGGGHGGFLGDLSPALRNEVKMCVFSEMLRQNPIFSSPKIQACAGIVEAVVAVLFTTVYLPGDVILRKGETSPWMGFIGTGGKVAVVLPPNKTCKILHEGDCIGELGLIYQARRTTDVKALVCVRVHVLTRDAFNSIKSQYPDEGALLEAEISNSLVKRGRLTEADLLKLTKRRKKRLSGHSHRDNATTDRRWSA